MYKRQPHNSTTKLNPTTLPQNYTKKLYHKTIPEDVFRAALRRPAPPATRAHTQELHKPFRGGTPLTPIMCCENSGCGSVAGDSDSQVALGPKKQGAPRPRPGGAEEGARGARGLRCSLHPYTAGPSQAQLQKLRNFAGGCFSVPRLLPARHGPPAAVAR